MTNFFNNLKTFFKPPVFEGDEEKTRDAKLLHQIVMAMWSVPFVAVISLLNPSTSSFVTLTGSVVAVALTIIMLLNRAGKAQLGSTILVGMVFIVMTYLNYRSAGEPRSILLLGVIPIIMGGLLLGTRGPIILTILIVAQHLIIVWLNVQGIIVPQSASTGPAGSAFLNTVWYLLIGFLLRLAIVRIQAAVSQLQSTNRELQQASAYLEERVEERTKALTTVSEISTVASTVLDTDKLLQQVVDLAKERFNLYHTHIYLLNEAGDALVLSSGAGEIGRQMVAEGRTIPLDHEQSLVARAAREKKGVTVNDVTTAPDFLPNPLLPDTHSEMAVPMIVGDQVIGVFDVQSEVIGRFTEADIAVQTTLASQAASAIQNARLYTRAEAALDEAQSLVDYAGEGIAILDLRTVLWTDPNQIFAKTFGMTREELVKTGPKQMSPARQPDGRDSTEKAAEMINTAMEKGMHSFEWVHTTAQGNDFPCEIRLVRLPGEHPRLRQSILDITERKHLEELTAQRAYQQETINTITQKIQNTATIESALQIAARELGHLFGKKPAVVSLGLDEFTSGETSNQSISRIDQN